MSKLFEATHEPGRVSDDIDELGWERYVGSGGAIIGTPHFGASAPGASDHA
jgi:hypothetical protein